jgi:hypothetical protein
MAKKAAKKAPKKKGKLGMTKEESRKAPASLGMKWD